MEVFLQHKTWLAPQNNTGRDQIFCLDLAEVKDEMLPENNNSVGSTQK